MTIVVLPHWPLYVGVWSPYLDRNVWFQLQSACVVVFICCALLCVWSWLWNLVASLWEAFRHDRVSRLVYAILITLGLGNWICFVCFYVVVSVVFSIERRVVQEEALSAVTSAPELRHNKARCFQKNESRIDFSSGINFSTSARCIKIDYHALLTRSTVN